MVCASCLHRDELKDFLLKLGKLCLPLDNSFVTCTILFFKLGLSIYLAMHSSVTTNGSSACRVPLIWVTCCAVLLYFYNVFQMSSTCHLCWGWLARAVHQAQVKKKEMWPDLRKSVLLPMSADSIFHHKQNGTWINYVINKLHIQNKLYTLLEWSAFAGCFSEA